MKTLILSGGYGTRLRPLTLTKAKPLVEFANKPIILHQIEALIAAGFTEVILAVSYHAEEMEQVLMEKAKKLGVTLTFSLDEDPLGTGGALKMAEKLLSCSDDPFFVLLSDVICEFPFTKLLDFHKANGVEGTIVVTEVKEPSKYGVVLYDNKGKINCFVEKPQKFVSNKISAGIYIFNPSILKRIEDRSMNIEMEEIFPSMIREGQLHAYELEGFWMDIGQPKDYLTGMCLYLEHCERTNNCKLSKEPSIVGAVLVDPSAKIGKNCCIGPNVTVGPDVQIEDGVSIKRSTILKGSIIKSHTWIDNCIIGWKCIVGQWVHMDNCSVLGEGVIVNDGVYINGGMVHPHRTIDTSILKPRTIT